MAARKMLLVNPSKRRSRRKTTARRKSPAKRRTTRTPARKTTRSVKRRTRAASPARRRRRSNPARRGIMGKYVRPAAMGGGTAVGLDVAFGYLPLPDVLSTGMARHAAKAAAAIGVGMFAKNLGMKAATAEEMGRGALTVYAADAMREGMASFLPDVPLGYYSPAYVPPNGGGNMNAYLSEYVSGAEDPMGAEEVTRHGTGFGEYVDPTTGDTAAY